LIDLLDNVQRNKTNYRPQILEQNLQSINGLLIDVRSEQVSVSKTIELLEATTPATDVDKPRFDESITRLRDYLRSIERLLGEYYLLRLSINTRAINARRRQVEDQEQSVSALQLELTALHKRLLASQSLWRRTVDRRQSKQEFDVLQTRITELAQEINAKEVVIPENDLTNWLDTIVDANLNAYSSTKISESARQARIALYYLLNKFCTIQERAALQIAQNPFLQINPKEAINFVLKTEQFILDYFANKKKDTTAWLSGAAKAKLDELDGIQKDILTELRRANKIHRK
jgi:hypothetical protein